MHQIRSLAPYAVRQSEVGANICSAFFPGCARVYTYVAHVSYASFPHLNKNMTHTRLIIGGGVSMCHLQQVPGPLPFSSLEDWRTLFWRRTLDTNPRK